MKIDRPALIVTKSAGLNKVSALLQHVGVKLHSAQTFNEATEIIRRQMPHIIFCEALLSGFDAAKIYDWAAASDVYKKIPIVALIANRSDADLAPLKNRKFAAAFLGEIDPNTFMAKVVEILPKIGSPFEIEMNQLAVNHGFSISFPAQARGIMGEHVIFESATRVDPNGALVCKLANDISSEVTLRKPSNQQNGPRFLNIFPLNQAVGKGREWVLGLPRLDDNDSQQPCDRTMILCGKKANYQAFDQLLLGHQIKTTFVETLPELIKATDDSKAKSKCALIDDDCFPEGFQFAKVALEEIGRAHV